MRSISHHSDCTRLAPATGLLWTVAVTSRPHYARYGPAARGLRARPPPLHTEPTAPPCPFPPHPADALKSLFRDIVGCPGRHFGSPSPGVLGISDGNEGVQWNAGDRPGDGFVWLGVNLEGMQYDDWPVARLIEREISRPLLLTRYPRKGRKTR